MMKVDISDDDDDDDDYDDQQRRIMNIVPGDITEEGPYL